MKKLVNVSFYILLLCLPFISYSQKHGEVQYKKEMIIPEDIFSSLKSSNPQLYRQRMNLLQEIVQATAQIEYKLTFNERESLFKAMEILSKEGGLINSIQSKTGIFYNSTSSNSHLQQIERQGKTFRVKRNNITWEITDETKSIDGVICYKAESKQNYYNYRTDKNIVRNIEAWFAPEFPASFGPEGYGGLPGLILELSLAGEHYSATKIDFNLSNLKIEKPSKGEEVSFEEYQSIIAGMGERFKQFQGIE